LHKSFLGYVVRGRCRYLLHMYKESKSDFTEADRLCTNTPSDWADLLPAYQRIRQTNPTYGYFNPGGFQFCYGLVLMRLNEDDAALARLNRAIQLGVTVEDVYRCRAEVYRRLGNLKAAQADLKSAKAATTSTVHSAAQEGLKLWALPSGP